MSKYKILNRLLAAVSIAAVLAGTLPQAAWAADEDAGLETAAAVDDSSYQLQNGSFEDYTIGEQTYVQVPQADVPKWNTTAFQGKIELYQDNTDIYVKNHKLLQIPHGKIGAELNADEASTLYQDIKAYSGSVLEWGLTHRGRDGADTMLLCIGPKQAVSPAKSGKNPSAEDDATDQFMKMGKWLHAHADNITILDGTNGGCIGATIYSKKFAANGAFVKQSGTWTNSYEGEFSFTKTAELTEEWHVWIIKSPKDAWYKYGSNLHKENTITDIKNGNKEYKYSYNYTVPTGTNELTFAFSAYSTYAEESATTEANKIKGKTMGNLIDDVSFKIKCPVTIYTTDGGSGSYYETENGEKKTGGVEVPVDDDETTETKKYGTELLDKNTQYTITAKPKDTFSFTGAYVKEGSNGDIFIPADCFIQSNDEDNTVKYTYTYTEDTVPETNPVTTTATVPTVIKLIFAYPPWIAYDPNGGTYKDSPNVTYIENGHPDFNFTKDNTEYIAEAAAPPNNEAWQFKHWLYKGGTAAGNSTVHYYLRGENSTLSDEIPPADSYADSTIDMTQDNPEIDTINEDTVDAPSSEINSEEDTSITFGEDSESSNVQEVIDNSETNESTTQPEFDENKYKSGYFIVKRNDGTVDNTEYPAADGLTFIAQWQYMQKAITQLGFDTNWENSDVGGTVNCISGYNGDAKKDTFTLYGYSDAGSYVSYEAKANPGYTFNGWYELSSDGSIDFLTTASTYGYTVDKENPVKTLYARFEWNSALATTYVSFVQQSSNSNTTAPTDSPFAEGSHTKKIVAGATSVPNNDVVGRKELGNTLSTGFMFDFTPGNVSKFNVDINIPQASDDKPAYIKSSFGRSIEPQETPTTGDYLGTKILEDDEATYLGGTVNLLKQPISKSFDLPTTITGARTTTVVFGIIIDGIYAPAATAHVNQGTIGTTLSSGLTSMSTDSYREDSNNGYSKYTAGNTTENTATNTVQ